MTDTKEPLSFQGYRRPDGRAGIRNHILILPASVCASDTAEQIARQVEGAVSFHNQTGCSQVPSDMQYTMDVLAGFAANPNVYGTIVIALGCENCQCDLVVDAIRERTCKPLVSLVIQHEGGTIRTVEKAVRIARNMAAEASMAVKETISVSELILATECGGSDPTSGLAANPVIGCLCDRIIAAGGTAILSETTEFIGAEKILAKRAANQEVHDRILDIVARYEEHFRRNGENVRRGNPSPGNKEGGITTLEEKSLGCIHKGGSTEIKAVFDYGKQIPVTQKGLVIMDTPGNDPSSIAGMLAGGAQVCVFSSGRGTPLGSPIAPVIKITGNAGTWAVMEDNIDFDASSVITENRKPEDLSADLYQMLLSVCSGRLTKAELLGFTETAVMRACNYV